MNEQCCSSSSAASMQQISYSSDMPSGSTVCTLANENHDAFQLHQIFGPEFSVQQIDTIYEFTGKPFDATLECLLAGENLKSLLFAINENYDKKRSQKLNVNKETAWEDVVAYYKSPRLDMTC